MKSLTLLGILIALVPAVTFRGFVLSKLWLWFIVPLGVTDISIAHAIGISIISAMILSHLKREDFKSENDKWWAPAVKSLSYSTFLSLLSWGLGAILLSGTIPLRQVSLDSREGAVI